MYVLSPVLVTLVMAILLAVDGAVLCVYYAPVEMKIEYEADRNAALYLVVPKQLAER
jgi:Zn-dependent protease with chaperone function